MTEHESGLVPPGEAVRADAESGPVDEVDFGTWLDTVMAEALTMLSRLVDEHFRLNAVTVPEAVEQGPSNDRTHGPSNQVSDDPTNTSDEEWPFAPVRGQLDLEPEGSDERTSADLVDAATRSGACPQPSPSATT